MKISVILCTMNRAESLAKALNSLAGSVLPEAVEWEVLVVDNNSSDATPGVAESFCRRDPDHFKYTLEARPGKVHALNRGIRESSGDVLAFTDDDVIVDPKWIQNLTAKLNDGSWIGAGGRILPEREFLPPRWLPVGQRYALAPLTIFDPGLPPGPLHDAPFGANMAFQRRAFEQYGGFRSDLGPGLGRGTPQKSEDTEFGHRLLDAGEKLLYQPTAVVYHNLPASRLNKKYFLNWWFDKARADIRAFGIPRHARWSIAGVPVVLFRRVMVWAVRWITTVNPARRFECKLQVWGRSAEIVECYRQSRLQKQNKAVAIE